MAAALDHASIHLRLTSADDTTVKVLGETAVIEIPGDVALTIEAGVAVWGDWLVSVAEELRQAYRADVERAVEEARAS